MFPLGSVLFPGVGIPLRVFEPRYDQLVRDCATDGAQREFAIVLIERGSEVGGGDVRTDVGTRARIVELAPLAPGQWALIAVGTERCRVVEWLPDDPYPRAVTEPWPEAGEVDADHLGRTLATLRRALALATELGEARAPATVEFAPDPRLALNQACSVAPIGPLDQQDLLLAPDQDTRLARLDEHLDGAVLVLEARLAAGGDR